jgi:Right handed beta helix region
MCRIKRTALSNLIPLTSMLFLAMTLSALPAFATTYFVPEDATFISLALDLAVSGDTIMVAAGFYTEEIDFNGKEILLKSISGPEVTTINGYATDSPTIFIHNGEGPELVIDGFTITAPHGSQSNGSGIEIIRSTPTIINNIITGNYKSGINVNNDSVLPDPLYIGTNTITENHGLYDGPGGGVYVNVVSPDQGLIENNTITNNVVSYGFEWGLAYGGGVWANCNVVNNLIEGNLAEAYMCYGAGLQLENGATASGNVITNNIARALDTNPSGEAYGGGVWANGNLTDNLIANNSIVRMGFAPRVSGAGVHLYGSGGHEVSNNTIVGNMIDGAAFHQLGAAGLATGDSGSYEITNNVITHNGFVNVSGSVGGVSEANAIGFHCNNVWGNDVANYSDADWTGVDGNISENPLYCGSPDTGPYTLAYESPCTESANPYCGLMGAFPVDCVRYLNVPDFYTTIQFALDAASPGDTVMVAPGTYSEHDLAMKSGVVLLGQPGETANTVIDGNALGPVINCIGVDADATIGNFTITNGDNGTGGGIYCFDSHLQIANCILHSNHAGEGGAIYFDNASPTLENLTIYGNEVIGYGGGLLCNNSTPYIQNTIIANNGGQAVHCSSNPGIPTLVCCNLFGNTGGDWHGAIQDQGGMNNNISSDPMFCSPDDYNFKIQYDSPCGEEQNPACDLIGACPVGCWPIINVPGDAATIQAGIDMAQAGDWVVVAQGTYYEFNIEMKSGVYLTSETGEADCVTIDAEQNGYVFFCSNVDSLAAINGFTITGGESASFGGGVFLLRSDLTISNCVITGNICTNEESGGGGLYVYQASPAIEWCTFVDNTAYDGCHVYLKQTGVTTIHNTILAFGNDGDCLYRTDEAGLVFTCSNVYGNGSGDYVGDLEYLIGVFGNTCQPPNFCDYENGDLHLRPCSPCIVGSCERRGAFGVGGCGPRTIRVPEDAATIEYALNEAACNDTINIACGEYIEQNLSFANPVVLRSESGEPDCVTIDADQQGELLRLSAGFGISTIKGVTFTGISGGAALVADANELLVENCSFNDNTLSNAIVSSQCALTVKNCTFANNSAPTTAYPGLFRFTEMQAVFHNSLISENSGPLFELDEGTLDFACSDIYGNTSGDWDAYGLEMLLGQNGNISADPLFCFPEFGAYNVEPDSPCAPECNPVCGLIGAWPARCFLADVGDDETDRLPTRFALYSNNPNPIQRATTISFALPRACKVNLSILDVTGRIVTTLIDDIYLPGEHAIVWNGTNSAGHSISSGVYFYHLGAGDNTATRKLLIAR